MFNLTRPTRSVNIYVSLTRLENHLWYLVNLSISARDKKIPIEFLSPMAEETIRNNSGEVMVNFNISPEYLGKFELLLDNQLVNTKGKMQFTLENVPRGQHQLEVKLRDNSGKIFASSGQQTFYLHQASALIHAN